MRTVNDQLVQLTDQIVYNIERRGWTQDTFEDAQGHVCIIGAGNYAADDLGLQGEIFTLWGLEFSKLINSNVSPWNDKPGRTVEEVLAKLDEFKAELKGR